MIVRNGLDGIIIWTPAKLNLFFEILSKRSDGFHEIETLMTPIDLYDTLYINNAPAGQTELTCDWACGLNRLAGSLLGTVPEGTGNLVFRALELLREVVGVSELGISIRLVKRIPSAAGLGGASSDAAAALVGANQLWNLRLRTEQLMEIAARLGSDIPFFLRSGACVCRGKGEMVTPVDRIGPLHVVVVRPPVGLETARVYHRCQVPTRPNNLRKLLGALNRGDLPEVGRGIFNRLEPAASELTNTVSELKREFDRIDGVGHQLTGSGSCYFGLFRHRRHARRAAETLRGRNIGMVYQVRTIC